MVAVDDALPEMTVSSVGIALRRDAESLWLAYLMGGDDRGCAVVRFDGVEQHSFGPPNDERLHLHPLWGRGLRFYAFHQVADAPSGKIHWIATFHDGALNVVATCCCVMATEVDAADAEAALTAVSLMSEL